MPEAKFNSEDLVVIRRYRDREIDIYVKIDRIQGKASLVKPGPNHTFVPQQFLFNERETGYMKTWLRILEVMKYATQAAISDLEESKEKKIEKLAQMNYEIENGPTKR